MPKCFYLLFVVLLASCTKGSQKPSSGSGDCRITSMTHLLFGNMIFHESYSYDINGRITKININDNVGDSTYYLYDYEPGKIIQSVKPNTIFLGSSTVFFLDAQNRVTKSVLAALPNTSEIHTYAYDAVGHLSLGIEIDSGNNNKHIDSALLSYGSNGNLTEILHREAYIYVPTNNKTQGGYYSTSFTQTNDPVEYLGGYESELESFEDIYNHRVITKYLGKGSVNAISSYTHTYNNGFLVNYSYVKDNKGNIVSMTETGPGRTDTYNFTYNCQ